MAKSKIIKDLANGVVDTQTALKRTNEHPVPVPGKKV